MIDSVHTMLDDFTDLSRKSAKWLCVIAIIHLALGGCAIGFCETVLLEHITITDEVLLYLLFYLYLLMPGFIALAFGAGLFLLSKYLQGYSYKFLHIENSMK